jgi:uncharacterized membrane protein YhaH (DUF805 family)
MQQHIDIQHIDPSMMGTIGVIVLVAIVIVVFLIVFPIVKILHKAGYSGWWVLLYFVPLGAFIGLWVFAFADWPALRKGQS